MSGKSARLDPLHESTKNDIDVLAVECALAAEEEEILQEQEECSKTPLETSSDDDTKPVRRTLRRRVTVLPMNRESAKAPPKKPANKPKKLAIAPKKRGASPKAKSTTSSKKPKNFAAKKPPSPANAKKVKTLPGKNKTIQSNANKKNNVESTGSCRRSTRLARDDHEPTLDETPPSFPLKPLLASRRSKRLALEDPVLESGLEAKNIQKSGKRKVHDKELGGRKKKSLKIAVENNETFLIPALEKTSSSEASNSSDTKNPSSEDGNPSSEDTEPFLENGNPSSEDTKPFLEEGEPSPEEDSISLSNDMKPSSKNVVSSSKDTKPSLEGGMEPSLNQGNNSSSEDTAASSKEMKPSPEEGISLSNDTKPSSEEVVSSSEGDMDLSLDRGNVSPSGDMKPSSSEGNNPVEQYKPPPLADTSEKSFPNMTPPSAKIDLIGSPSLSSWPCHTAGSSRKLLFPSTPAMRNFADIPKLKTKLDVTRIRGDIVTKFPLAFKCDRDMVDAISKEIDAPEIFMARSHLDGKSSFPIYVPFDASVSVSSFQRICDFSQRVPDGRRYANDEILNFFSVFMTRNDGINHLFLSLPTGVFQKLESCIMEAAEMKSQIESLIYGSMRKNEMYFKTTFDMFKVKVIDIPVHYAALPHWSRAFVCNIEHVGAKGKTDEKDPAPCILFVDSLPGLHSMEKVGEDIRRLLSLLSPTTMLYTEENLPIYQLGFPKQFDGVSCGYRTLMAASAFHNLVVGVGINVTYGNVSTKFCNLASSLEITPQSVARFVASLKTLVIMLANYQHGISSTSLPQPLLQQQLHRELRKSLSQKQDDGDPAEASPLDQNPIDSLFPPKSGHLESHQPEEVHKLKNPPPTTLLETMQGRKKLDFDYPGDYDNFDGGGYDDDSCNNDVDSSKGGAHFRDEGSKSDQGGMPSGEEGSLPATKEVPSSNQGGSDSKGKHVEPPVQQQQQEPPMASRKAEGEKKKKKKTKKDKEKKKHKKSKKKDNVDDDDDDERYVGELDGFDLPADGSKKNSTTRLVGTMATSVNQIKDAKVRSRVGTMLKFVGNVQTHTTYEAASKRKNCPQCRFVLVSHDSIVEDPYYDQDIKTRDKPLVSVLLPPFMKKEDFNAIWKDVYAAVNGAVGDEVELGSTLRGSTSLFHYNVTSDSAAFHEGLYGRRLSKSPTGKTAAAVEKNVSKELGAVGKQGAATPAKFNAY